jgi:Ni,Fe-hydrogenase maturation factor
MMGLKVDPIIIGIEPKDMDLGYDEMTPEVEAAIPEAIALVLEEISR